MAKRRRSVLAATASAVASSLAGCLDGIGGSGETNGSNGNDSSGDAPEVRTPLSVDSAFPQHQFDGGNTGNATNIEGPTGAIRSLFEFGTGTVGSGHQLGSPSVADGTVYVTEHAADTATTTVYAVDAVDGTTQWGQTYTETDSAGPTAVVDGTVLAAVSGGVVGLDTATGDQQWSLRCQRESGLTVADGTVYLVGVDGDSPTLYALSVADGTVQWTKAIDAAAYRPTPAVAGDTVYAGGDALQALDTETGAQRWRSDDAVSAAPTVVEDSVVAISEGVVRVVEAADGTERWSGELPVGETAVTHSPAVADDTVYVGAEGIAAYDLGSGEQRYTRELAVDGPPVVAGDHLYLFASGQLGCLSARDGATEWAYGTQQRADPGDRAPAVVDGVAYFPAEKLYAITA
jgi:outer membrane protein assembly factor BamB